MATQYPRSMATEELITAVSSRFIHTTPKVLTPTWFTTFQNVGTLIGAEFGMLFFFDHNLTALVYGILWIPGISDSLENISGINLDVFPGY